MPPGFCVYARKAVSPRAIHILSPDLVTMESLMIIPLRVARKTLFEAGGRSCLKRKGRSVYGKQRAIVQ